ncbi:hypothetical protein [Hydrogenovibrio marinus]|uniref:hypothetical protein n=1 Tax=Hydrogenovibrio marinus TaxID=28885 RepID=UPI0012DD52C0|nr:hypothetical protein [Hydrogenovibrio marinus]
MQQQKIKKALDEDDVSRIFEGLYILGLIQWVKKDEHSRGVVLNQIDLSKDEGENHV